MAAEPASENLGTCAENPYVVFEHADEGRPFLSYLDRWGHAIFVAPLDRPEKLPHYIGPIHILKDCPDGKVVCHFKSYHGPCEFWLIDAELPARIVREVIDERGNNE